MASQRLDIPFRGIEDVKKFEEIPEENWLRNNTVYDAFCETAERFPTKDALIIQPMGDPLGEGKHITFRELKGKIHQTANMFLEAGLAPDESVTNLLPLTAEAYYTLFAAESVGIINSVNPMLEPEHIVGIMQAAKSRILVAPGRALSAEIWEKVEYIIRHLPELKAVILLGGSSECDGEFIKPFTQTMEVQRSERIKGLPARSLDDIVGYYHTGGTTGVPKLAPHTNRMQLLQRAGTGFLLGYSEKDTMIGALPLFHISGSIVVGMVPLLIGVTLVVPSPIGFRDPLVVGNYWNLVDKFSITVLGAVPTVLSALLNIPVGDADVSTLRIGATGGSAAPVEVLKEITKKSGVMMAEGYGMTEVTSFTTLMPRDAEPKFGSIGVRQPYVDVKAVILDDAGNIVRDADVDEIGVIVMKGTTVMPGYVQSEHNAKAFTSDGWINSGDLGRVDKDGYIWLTGRAKDLIIRSGHNIDPALIEEPLHEHPAVELAAAIGRPDNYTGEMPIAYVQLKPGMSVTEDELKEFARERIVERAGNPAEINIIDEMPLTGVGKIFKPALRMEATERVVKLELANFENSSGNIDVEMENHPNFGLTARLKVSGGKNEELEKEIHHKIGAYTFHHEIDWI
ncbi:acyl-CoA synthetase [Sneathiella sp. P13V-1]|uniref:acyl-CoA synthetase n=1 Tax=Sneathiella sp. P13V-1 TaxID=2697366 RepID=UPI00187BB459|nr:acyl-CoA synthetase [Sneathiella sp. P13V-1]MBE7637663.1 acyl-CoA synthetase [Sneathiella sp. P13V-1]